MKLLKELLLDSRRFRSHRAWQSLGYGQSTSKFFNRSSIAGVQLNPQASHNQEPSGNMNSYNNLLARSDINYERLAEIEDSLDAETPPFESDEEQEAVRAAVERIFGKDALGKMNAVQVRFKDFFLGAKDDWKNVNSMPSNYHWASLMTGVAVEMDKIVVDNKEVSYPNRVIYKCCYLK